MWRLVLFLLACAPAFANVPKPPAGAEGYMVYLLVGFVTVTVTTGGQLVIAVLGHMKNGGKSEPVECKAEPSRCFFGRSQHEQLEGAHGALHYHDEEGTERPVLSGHWRQQSDAIQGRQTALLERLVELGEQRAEEAKEQTQLLRSMSKPPSDGGGGMDL